MLFRSDKGIMFRPSETTVNDKRELLKGKETDATCVYKLDFTTVGTGAMPEGWRTVQGNDEVHEYPNTYGQGARTFAGFEGYQGKALYWREKNAEYGRQEAYPLTLSPGTYRLSYAVAAWKGQPEYRVSVIDASSGKAVAASGVHKAAPNAGGSNTADMSGAACNELEVVVRQEGNYVISFRNVGDGFSEYLLLECKLSNDALDSIEDLTGCGDEEVDGIYGIDGVKRDGLQKGLNIIVFRGGKSKKIICR